MIYLDNSATSYFKPEKTIEVITKYLKSPGNPGRGVNKASVGSASLVFDTRMKIANFFNVPDFSKVVFTSGITESLNTVISGIIKKDDYIITTYLEHNSTLRPLYKTSCELSITDGSVEEIEKSIKENTKAVVVNHVSNVTGEVQDIEKIGELCKEKNILFIVDAAQSAGVLPIDIVKNNISILCFTGHKGLMGMQGIGGMVLNTNMYIEPLKCGGTGIHSFAKEQPKEYPAHLEAGTLNVPGIISLNASIDYINEYGIDNIFKHEMELKQKLIEYLKSRKDISIYENLDRKSVGVVSFNIKDKDAAYIGDYLSEEYDICVRTGAHCAPLVMKHYDIDSSVRVSFGLNNKLSDVDVLIDALEKIN